MMSFDEACEIVKAFPESDGSLLSGLEAIREELENSEDEMSMWLSNKEVAAYRIVCREMRKLFI